MAIPPRATICSLFAGFWHDGSSRTVIPVALLAESLDRPVSSQVRYTSTPGTAKSRTNRTNVVVSGPPQSHHASCRSRLARSLPRRGRSVLR